jgi:predicted nuclease with TOPRIM domain
VQLKAELEKSQGDVASMAKFKNDYLRLKREMDNLMKENDALKKQNVTLTTQRDSTQVVLEDTRKVRDTLVAKNENLSKTVEKGSKLSVLNLQTMAVKQRSSGKQIDTDKASRADVLKISFMIAENQIAKSGDKTYHVQVIDSKNNVLGDKKTESFGDKTLTYSFEKTIKYENKTVQVSQDLPVKDIEGGTFFVNIFDKGELVSKTSFTLR